MFIDALNFYFPGFIFNGGFKNQFKEDKFMSKFEFINTAMNLINRRIDSFEWKGLPPSCSERLLEAILLFNGKICCYKTEDDTILMLPCQFGPEYNVNGEYLQCTVYSANNKVFGNINLYQPGIKEYSIISDGIMHKVPVDYQGVIGYENAMAFPYIFDIIIKAKQIANRERAIDVCVEAMKQPMILNVPETKVKSVLEEFRKVRDNEPIIMEFSPLEKDNRVEVLQTGVNADFLKVLREDLNCVKDWESELAGFNANPSHKRERNTVDEVNANNALIEANKDRGLLWRKKFCENVNDAFGLNISVNFRYNTETYEEGESDEKEQSASNKDIQSDSDRES